MTVMSGMSAALRKRGWRIEEDGDGPFWQLDTGARVVVNLLEASGRTSLPTERGDEVVLQVVVGGKLACSIFTLAGLVTSGLVEVEQDS